MFSRDNDKKLEENVGDNYDLITDIPKYNNGGGEKSKNSTLIESHSARSKSTNRRSWWFSSCLKIRPEESHPSWKGKIWNNICCLSYRQFSRISSISLIGLFTWIITYTVIGNSAAPGGQLFQLIVLSIAAHFGGWLISLTTLPALIGMLATGLLFRNVGIIEFDDSFAKVVKILREVSLVIILTRAGLDLDPLALKKLKVTVIKLGVGPWFAETCAMAITTHYILKFPWDWAFLLGSSISAISPAVVVPCLFRLRLNGYGVAKGIPTLTVAVAGIDDALSVAGFGIIRSVMFANESLILQILQGPICIFGGVGFGILWGAISSVIPDKNDPFVIPLRILMILLGGMISVMGSAIIGYNGAGPLGCVVASFVSLCFWSKQGWEIDENPATISFEIFWMLFEPILFGVTGAQINFAELSKEIVLNGLLCIVIGILIRMATTVLLGFGCRLNLKEKIFVGTAWTAKATVQAALSTIPLSLLEPKDSRIPYAEKFLMVSVIAIILTAPAGAAFITIFGPRFLTKTKVPYVPEGWKRSSRPSIKDVGVEDDEDLEENTNTEEPDGVAVIIKDESSFTNKV